MIIRIGLFCAGLLGCGNAVAQQSVPRAADGHPDFQGVWESLWLTPLELPDGVPSIHLTDAEAMHVKQMFLEREDRRAKNQLGTQGEIAIATNLLRIDGGIAARRLSIRQPARFHSRHRQAPASRPFGL